MISTAAEAPDEFLGLQFPRLKTDPGNWILPSDTVFGTPFTVEAMVRLYIAADGRVDSISYDASIRPDFVRGVKKSLAALSFEPAKIRGSEVGLVLPIRVTFSNLGNTSRANLTMPCDPATGGRIQNLIERTLVENGFTLPGLEYFPSYYVNIPRDSGRTEYDYVVFRIIMDSAGKASDPILYSTSNEKLADALTITTRYGHYRNAEYRGMTLPSEFYLIARFFDGFQNPTEAWPIDSSISTAPYFDRFRLETVLYLDSLIGPAFPKNLSGVFGFPEMSIDKDSIPAQVNITANGDIEWAAYEKHVSSKTREDLNRVLKLVKFIPALDSSGAAVPYRGQLLIIRAGGSNKLRINANWLP